MGASFIPRTPFATSTASFSFTIAHLHSRLKQSRIAVTARVAPALRIWQPLQALMSPYPLDNFFQAVALSYSRCVIKIVDLEMLKAMGCECCETLCEQGNEVERAASSAYAKALPR